jgi:hypothetical protein
MSRICMSNQLPLAGFIVLQSSQGGTTRLFGFYHYFKQTPVTNFISLKFCAIANRFFLR